MLVLDSECNRVEVAEVDHSSVDPINTINILLMLNPFVISCC